MRGTAAKLLNRPVVVGVVAPSQYHPLVQGPGAAVPAVVQVPPVLIGSPLADDAAPVRVQQLEQQKVPLLWYLLR